MIYANVALQAALLGMQAALGELQRNGQMGDATELAVDFAERQRLVRKDRVRRAGAQICRALSAGSRGTRMSERTRC